MILEIDNIGKIAHAEVAIDGITVIAGPNDTGKSTVGKALWSVFNGFHRYRERISSDRINSIERAFERALRVGVQGMGGGYRTSSISEASSEIAALCQNGTLSDEAIERCVRELFDDMGFDDAVDAGEEGRTLVARIREIFAVSDEEIHMALLGDGFNAEFNGQITNVYGQPRGSVRLTVKTQTVSVGIDRNKVDYIDGTISLDTEAIYVDDPYAVDDVPTWFRDENRRFNDHSHQLAYHLFRYARPRRSSVEELIADRKLSTVFKKIESVLRGDIIREGSMRRRLVFRRFDAKADATLDLRSISAGMKTFALLEMLILDGAIEQNGTIILDEPEIHLHPEWQLVFAEVIVLLHEEFGMHILLTTHSPYFLRAVEVYSRKHGASASCRYYLARDGGTQSELIDVTDNTDEIYKTLALPLQTLEDEAYGLD